VELAQNEAILRAFRTSIILGLMTAVISTTLGVLASLALVRYRVPGRNLITTLLIAPILVPEVVLAVALLLFLNFLESARASRCCWPAMSSSRCPSSFWWCRRAWSASAAMWRRRR
jgi:ABC-type spermidine/putrescine transport system permease subunit II